MQSKFCKNNPQFKKEESSFNEFRKLGSVLYKGRIKDDLSKTCITSSKSYVPNLLKRDFMCSLFEKSADSYKFLYKNISLRQAMLKPFPNNMCFLPVH